jgi:hypothetical protein
MGRLGLGTFYHIWYCRSEIDRVLSFCVLVGKESGMGLEWEG